MLKGLEYPKETLEIMKDRVTNDFENTNSLLVEDILKCLGYDIKRDKEITRLGESAFMDWSLGYTGMMVKVYPYGSPDMAIDEHKYDYVWISTNGERMIIYYGDDIVEDISSIYETNGYEEMLLKAISRLTFDIDTIKKSIKKISKEDIVNTLRKEKVSILGLMGIHNISENIKQMYNKSVDEIENGSTNNNIDIEEYRIKIGELTESIENLKEIIRGKESRVAELEKIVDEKGSEQERISNGLLDAIKDNKEAVRSYVGVINSKLYQEIKLEKFVGVSIQELYNIVDFDLMSMLFDGDIFSLAQQSVREDVMINGRYYDIDIEGITEEEILSRLRVLFEKFKDRVVFLCKAIGSKRENDEEHNTNDINDIIEDEEIIHEEVNEMDRGMYYKTKTISIPISGVFNLITNSKSQVIEMVGISYGDRQYLIEQDKVNDFIKAIHLLTGVSIDRFDYRSASDRISESGKYKIMGTEFGYDDTSIESISDIIVGIAYKLGVNCEDIKIYFRVKDDELMSNHEFIESIDIITEDSFRENSEIIHVILDGDRLDSINKECYDDAAHKIIIDTIAMRNEKTQAAIKNNKEIEELVNKLVEINDVEKINSYMCKDVLGISDNKIQIVCELDGFDKCRLLVAIDKVGYTKNKTFSFGKSKGLEIRVSVSSKIFRAIEEGKHISNPSAEYYYRKIVDLSGGRVKVMRV